MRISTAGNSTRQNHGFTLVELAVVVALLGLFAMLALPLFSSTGTGKLEDSARRLNGTVKYLFNEAVLSGQEHLLVFDLDHGSYRGKVVEPGGEIFDLAVHGKKSRLAGDVRFRDLQLPGRGTFTAGEVTVRIHPTGWMEELLVHLAEDTDQLTLHVMPLTGTGEIYEGYHSP